MAQTYAMKLQSFGGVDFSSNETQVSAKRSPDARNMIADEKFFPVKRTGTALIARFDGPVYGLHALGDVLLAHAGTMLYRTDTGEALYDNMNEAFSASFVMNDCLWLLDGQTYLRFDGAGVREVRDIAYVPTTSIGVKPSGKPLADEFAGDGETKDFALSEAGIDAGSAKVTVGGAEMTQGVTVDETAGKVIFETAPEADAPIRVAYTRTAPGGGTAFEAVNLLTSWRRNSFAGDGESPVYFLDTRMIYPDSVSVTVNGEKRTQGFAVDGDAGKITFETAPSDNGGVDNVVIVFQAMCDCGQSSINRCRFAGLYGGRNDTRVFMAGNPQNKNRDWQSGLYDPTYFPDTGYTEIGSDSTAIMGYARQYDAQVIVKESGQDATLWLRTFALDGGNRAYFPVAQGAAADGAIASRTFASLGDDPLFLSGRGVCAAAGTSVYQQRSVQNRSKLVNVRLTREDGLAGACAAVWHNKYCLAAGGHVYIADGAQGYADESGDRQYEWYFWDGIDASAMAVFGDRLYFGTADGRVLRLKDADEPDAYDDCGKAYEAHWVTVLTDMNNLYRTKTIRDVAYMLMPFSQSAFEVAYKSDRRDWARVRAGSRSLFDWGDVDFGNFSFDCLRVPETERTRRRERKAEVFSVRISNGEKSALGVLGIEIVFREAGRVR